jgi:hypothetical protein
MHKRDKFCMMYKLISFIKSINLVLLLKSNLIGIIERLLKKKKVHIRQNLINNCVENGIVRLKVIKFGQRDVALLDFGPKTLVTLTCLLICRPYNVPYYLIYHTICSFPLGWFNCGIQLYFDKFKLHTYYICPYHMNFFVLLILLIFLLWWVNHIIDMIISNSYQRHAKTCIKELL